MEERKIRRFIKWHDETTWTSRSQEIKHSRTYLGKWGRWSKSSQPNEAVSLWPAASLWYVWRPCVIWSALHMMACARFGRQTNTNTFPKQEDCGRWNCMCALLFKEKGPLSASCIHSVIDSVQRRGGGWGCRCATHPAKETRSDDVTQSATAVAVSSRKGGFGAASFPTYIVDINPGSDCFNLLLNSWQNHIGDRIQSATFPNNFLCPLC